MIAIFSCAKIEYAYTIFDEMKIYMSTTKFNFFCTTLKKRYNQSAKTYQFETTRGVFVAKTVKSFMSWSIRNKFLLYVYWICCLPLNYISSKGILHHSCLLGKPTITGNYMTQESIVILHGLLGSSKNFQAWSKILSLKTSQEYDIVCMDLR